MTRFACSPAFIGTPATFSRRLIACSGVTVFAVPANICVGVALSGSEQIRVQCSRTSRAFISTSTAAAKSTIAKDKLRRVAGCALISVTERCKKVNPFSVRSRESPASEPLSVDIVYSGSLTGD